MKFEYFAGEQRTPEWFKLRLGKVTASQLHAWLATSKAKGKEGKPLKARLDYEKELMFERVFDTSFENFVTGAMQDGVTFEPFARREYERITGNTVEECGAWFNDHFVASPDGSVTEKGAKKALGLLEIKIVRDNSFAEILTDGVPDKWVKQVQGQMWASGRAWTDFVAVNLNTKKLKIIRIEADTELHKELESSVLEDFHTTTDIFDTDQLYSIETPQINAVEAQPLIANQESKKLEGF